MKEILENVKSIQMQFNIDLKLVTSKNELFNLRSKYIGKDGIVTNQLIAKIKILQAKLEKKVLIQY